MEKDLVDILAAFSTPIVALLTAWIAYRQLKLEERDRKNQNIDIYLDCYRKIIGAKEDLFKHGEVTKEGLELFWTARDLARLRLPEDIAKYCEEVFQHGKKAFSARIGLQGISDIEVRRKKLDEIEPHETFLFNLKPHEIFREHLVEK